MKHFAEYWGILFFSIVIFIFIGKIIYILFKPKLLEKYKTFTNRNLSDFTLVLYYLLIIGTTTYLVVKLVSRVLNK